MQKETFQIRQVIGENIRRGRRGKGMTQEQFAEAIGISVQSVSAMENGMQFSRMETYFRVAQVMAVPLHILFSAHQSEGGVLETQKVMIFGDCSVDEQRVLLIIMAEIKSLLRKQRVE